MNWQGFKLPNLDDIDEAEADVWFATLQRAAAFAQVKSSALRLRKQGKIEAALSAEQEADSIYARLPQAVRW